MDLHCVEWFCWQFLFVTGHGPGVPCKVRPEGRWRSLPNEFLFIVSKAHPSSSKCSDSSWETQEMSFIFENAMLVHVEAPKCFSEGRQHIFMPLNLFPFSVAPDSIAVSLALEGVMQSSKCRSSCSCWDVAGPCWAHRGIQPRLLGVSEGCRVISVCGNEWAFHADDFISGWTQHFQPWRFIILAGCKWRAASTLHWCSEQTLKIKRGTWTELSKYLTENCQGSTVLFLFLGCQQCPVNFPRELLLSMTWLQHCPFLTPLLCSGFTFASEAAWCCQAERGHCVPGMFGAGCCCADPKAAPGWAEGAL